MTNLDVETLRFFAKIIITISALAMLAFWRSSGIKKGMGFWVLGISIYALFPYLSLPSGALFGINTNFLVDLCMISGPLLLLHGSRKVFDQAPLPYFTASIGLLAIGISLYISITNSAPQTRIVNASFFSAIIFGVISRSFIIQKKYTWNNPILPRASTFMLYTIYHSLICIYCISNPNANISLLISFFYCSSLIILGITMKLIHTSYKILQIEASKEQAASSSHIKDIENRWLLALDFSKAGYWEWDINTFKAHYSAQWKKMLGYSENAQVDNSLEAIVNRFHPDDAAGVKANMDSFLEGKTSIYESIHRMRNKNGEWIWILSRAKFLTPETNKEPWNIIGIEIDITAQKETEEALQKAIKESSKAKDEAEKANKAKTTFLSNMSHEIRTPMNAILGFSQLLQDDPSINTEQRESLDIINSSGQHLLSLIDSILDWSRIESGNAELLLDSFNPIELFQEISAPFTFHESQAQFDFHVKISPDLPQCISSDPMRIRQICTNLLGNAFKFTTQGSVTLTVDIEKQKQQPDTKTTLIIKVIDTGSGIKNAEKSTIFSIFGQTEAGMKAKQGSGLGLFISKNLASLLGGNLDLTSEENEPTCFTLKIPVKIDSPKEIPVQEIPPPFCQIKSLEKSGIRLLIVDDIESNRQLLQRMLNGLGFEITETDTAVGIIQLITDCKPDIVLMDIRMPGISGDTAINEIRRQSSINDLMIIAVTANVSEGEKERLIKIGANDVVSKPFSKQEVLHKISSLLNINYVYEPSIDQPSPLPPVEEGLDNKKILVVDDNEANCLLLRSQLQALGYNSEIAINGEEGLQCWRSSRFALILTDCAMPVMNGFEMTETIRNEESVTQDKATIIAITGSVEENRSRGLKSGMDDLLGKPLLLKALKDTLEKYVA